jgi:hypothetical protein
VAHTLSWVIATSSDDGGVGWVAVLAVVASVVSAAGVIVGGLYWLTTRGRRAERARREEEMSHDIAEMSESIEKLETLVIAVAEDAQGRRPEPVLNLVTAQGPATSVVLTLPAIPEVDIDAIVERERRAVELRRPRLPSRETPRARQEGKGIGGIAGLAGLARLAENLEAAGLSSHPRAVTEDDIARFDGLVERFLGRIPGYVHSWLRYLEERRRVIALSALIDNTGGAPAADARVRLHFPDPCRQAEWPEKPQRPWRPVFTPPKPPWMRALVAPPDYQQLLMTPKTLKPPNLTGPFYEDGSLLVRFDYAAIPHHDPITTPGFIVGVPLEGEMSVPWTIHASNLPRPAEGSLLVDIRYEPPKADPITTLDELVGPEEIDEAD